MQIAQRISYETRSAKRMNFSSFQKNQRILIKIKDIQRISKGVIFMPRGGARAGAGRPRKPLSARIDEGIDTVSHKKPMVLSFPDKPSETNLQSKQNAERIPTFLEMASRDGDDSLPSATEIYKQTLEWITDAGCERFVPPQLIEDFAFVRRGYLECEYMNKKLGRMAKGGKQSPYVKNVIEYLKQMTSLHREIWAIVAQNSTKPFEGNGSNSFLELLKNRGF